MVTSATSPASTMAMNSVNFFDVSFFWIWAKCQARKMTTRSDIHNMTVLNVAFTIFGPPAPPTTCASFVDPPPYPLRYIGMRRSWLRLDRHRFIPMYRPSSGERCLSSFILYAPRAAGAGQGDGADVGQPPVALGVVQAVP